MTDSKIPIKYYEIIELILNTSVISILTLQIIAESMSLMAAHDSYVNYGNIPQWLMFITEQFSSPLMRGIIFLVLLYVICKNITIFMGKTNKPTKKKLSKSPLYKANIRLNILVAIMIIMAIGLESSVRPMT